MVRQPAMNNTRNPWRRLWLLMPIGLCYALSGCTSVINPINAIPAEQIPPQFLAEPRANKRPVDVSLLRNIKPPSYILDKDDVLGVFIEGILGNATEAPPVTMPDPNTDLSPGIGFPIPIRDDGTISLPLIEPIAVRGLTVSQVEELIKKRYRDLEFLVNPRVIVTLLRKRTYRVFVIRQDNTRGFGSNQNLQTRAFGVFERSDLSSRGFVLNLPAYENDVLNALSQTGGLPGVNARAEVTILRGDNVQTEERFQQLREMYAAGQAAGFDPNMISSDSSITIPLRLAPDEIPNFRPEDVILRDGDVVVVETRDTEVYYTGGLLSGGEFPLPRDYDLDVLGAIAVAGQGVSVTSRDIGFGGGFTRYPPTELVVLRKLPGNRQIAIKVNLVQAINSPQTRLLVAPGDTLILRYNDREEVLNFALGIFSTFGLRELFRR